MTLAQQILLTIAAAVASGLLVHLIKEWRAQAKRGRQADEHQGLVTTGDCELCREEQSRELRVGSDLFRLILEGQALHTQALIRLCDNDDGCRELRAKLQDYLGRLATRQIGGR
ncbi:MAG: hypothetical protein C4525_03230 [Desulfarculus sp.]|jgi:hypothetical protein|nr:MAG: hypothetical protein C4525_03230 [Desulfarculus sp.]